eukprot:4955690-Amphidinium_carterae.1
MGDRVDVVAGYNVIYRFWSTRKANREMHVKPLFYPSRGPSKTGTRRPVQREFVHACASKNGLRLLQARPKEASVPRTLSVAVFGHSAPHVHSEPVLDNVRNQYTEKPFTNHNESEPKWCLDKYLPNLLAGLPL